MPQSAPMIALQEAADGVARLLTLLKRKKKAQIRSKEDQQLIKATALAWFNNYRNSVVGVDTNLFKSVEIEYTALFEASSRASNSRHKYLEVLKRLSAALVVLQKQVLINSNSTGSSITKPDFSPLVPDVKMRQILENRWHEIVKCLECGASLSATIMMGGLLEALFLAEVNKTPDKSPIFKAKASPKELKSGRTKPLNEWTLNAYIDVAAELGWITRPAKDISVVLRDYRNFIHPERELSTGITLTLGDAQMLWSVCVQLVEQIISREKTISGNG